MIERSIDQEGPPIMTTDTAKAAHAEAPAGYRAVKATASFDQFAKIDTSAEGPAWLTRCNEHNTTTSADNRKAGRTLGSAAQRATWCRGCKSAAAKTAAAK
jgi:hypothetical protein